MNYDHEWRQSWLSFSKYRTQLQQAAGTQEPIDTMITTSTSSQPPSTISSESQPKAMAMVTTLFFMWGFLTSLNDILVPHLKAIFDLKYVEVMLVQFAFFSSYFIFAVPSGKLVEWIGYKRTMVAGLLTMAVGAIMFVPAASVPSFPLFLSALIVLAAGITALQVAANPYVSVLGPARTASSRLNLTQAFNSLGTTLAPYLGGMLILSAAPLSGNQLSRLAAPALLAYRQHEASSVKLPYIGIAIALAALALSIAMFRLPRLEVTREFRSDVQVSGASIWRQRQLVLGALGIFLYVGAEVSIGSFLVNYFSLPAIGNLSARVAAGYVSFYWGGAMIGRFIGSAVLQKVRTGSALAVAALVACLLVVTSMLSIGHIAMWTILSVGIFNSIMFPSIFTLGIEGLGALTGKGSGLMVSAIVGGAVVPLIEAAFADRIGIQHAFLLPVLCYLYIAYYGYYCARTQSASEQHRFGPA